MDFKKLPMVNGVPVSLVGHQHTIEDLVVLPCAKLIKTATQNYTGNVTTKATWQGADWDLTGGFNAANSRLLLPASLYGNRLFQVDYALFLNNTSAMTMYVYVNGANALTMLSTTVLNKYFYATGYLTAAAGDYIELWLRGVTGRTIQTTSWCHIRQIG
jgi:hypothetical protein